MIIQYGYYYGSFNTLILLLLLLTRWSLWTLRKYLNIFWLWKCFDFGTSTFEILFWIFFFNDHSIWVLLWIIWYIDTTARYYSTIDTWVDPLHDTWVDPLHKLEWTHCTYLSRLTAQYLNFEKFIFSFLLQWSFNTMGHSMWHIYGVAHIRRGTYMAWHIGGKLPLSMSLVFI